MSAEASATAAQTARDETLELTGWGLPFRFWQPHNFCFWVYLLLSAAGMVSIWDYFSDLSGALGTALSAGIVATFAYGLIFVVVLRVTDHYERQPKNLVLAGFLWGGVAATFGIAIKANAAMIELYPKLFGQAFGSDWSTALTAPFTEETSKAAGFILLLGLAPRLIRSAYDGVFIGAFIGLGFQLFENVLYTFNSSISAFGVDQAHAALGTFALRAATGIFSHTLYSAIFCLGIMYVVGSPILKRRVGLGIALMLLSMLAHGTWDGLAAIGGVSTIGFVLVPVLSITSLVVLLLMLHKSVPQEREFLRAVLRPEVDNGTLSQEELDALCATRRRRKAFIRSGSGHRSHRNAKLVLRSALDLAHEIADARGAESEGVRHERAEIARLRELATA